MESTDDIAPGSQNEPEPEQTDKQQEGEGKVVSLNVNRNVGAPLRQLLEKKDLNAAAACLAFAELLESAGNIEQAEFFYEQTRSILAELAAEFVSDQE